MAGQAHPLTEPARQFLGIVRRADGRPFAHAMVSLVDATVLGPTDAPCVLEAIAADDHRVLHVVYAEADGAFRLDGLADRPYRLRIVDPTTAAWFTTEPLPPGRAAITAPADLVHQEHTVQLRTPAGEPLAGASVIVQSTSYLLRLPDQRQRDVLFAAGSSGTTDAKGRVTLRMVPRSGAHLRIHHRATGHDYAPLADQPESQLVLAPVGEVIARLAAPRGDEWLELLDAHGEPVPLRCLSGIGLRIERSWPLLHGHSPVLQAPSDAVQARIGSPRGHAVLPVTVRPGERVAIDG